MEVFCTAADEFDAEAIIVDLKGAGLAENEISVLHHDKMGNIVIAVHADDYHRATRVKSIVSEAGAQDVAMRNEAEASESAGLQAGYKLARQFGSPLRIVASAILSFCTGR
jgi:hypothetical protein